MKAAKLYLVRHGKTMFNLEKKVQGWSDSFLIQEGIDGAITVGKAFAEQEQIFDAVYVSDSGRTLQTARLILEHAGMNPQMIIPDARLREFNFGYFEGTDDDAMHQAIIDYAGVTMENHPVMEAYFDTVKALDDKHQTVEHTWHSEDSQTYLGRLNAVMQDIAITALRDGHENVLIISHGVTISAIISSLFPQEVCTPREIPNTSVSELLYDGNAFQLLGLGKVYK